jgi:hypothetical protein
MTPHRLDVGASTGALGLDLSLATAVLNWAWIALERSKPQTLSLLACPPLLKVPYMALAYPPL